MTLISQVEPIRWEAGQVKILDQRALPAEERYMFCSRVEDVAEAIVTLAVRGAPLIGITAAYGMALAARVDPSPQALFAADTLLGNTRPTAVNLHWALDRCRLVWSALAESDSQQVADALLKEARAIHTEDAEACAAMAQAGKELLPSGARVLTHCNTGALATGGVGTALGVIRAGYAAGKVAQVWVDETRPLLQGARLTAWELQREGIPYRLICDNMAASLMSAGQVDVVIVGADRIAKSGDFANKIGTYGLAVLAREHDIPFYVAAPWSTIDMKIQRGNEIPIEFREEGEVCRIGDIATAPTGAQAWNPAFDVTSCRYVRAYITERGVLEPPFYY